MNPIQISLYVLILFTPMSPKNSQTDNELLPERIGSWTIDTEAVYTPENLYDYINGGAELYISYGFKKVYTRI